MFSRQNRNKKKKKLTEESGRIIIAIIIIIVLINVTVYRIIVGVRCRVGCVHKESGRPPSRSLSAHDLFHLIITDLFFRTVEKQKLALPINNINNDSNNNEGKKKKIKPLPTCK